MPILVCKLVTYYSRGDEDMFFEWLARIRCIVRIEGVGDELRLHIPRKQISNANLRELIAIFERYKIEMKQLGQFLTDKNKAWFKDDPRVFWRKKVYR